MPAILGLVHEPAADERAPSAERGYGRVEWAVLNWNEPAIGFFRALGAQPQDEWTVYRLTGAALQHLAART